MLPWVVLVTGVIGQSLEAQTPPSRPLTMSPLPGAGAAGASAAVLANFPVPTGGTRQSFTSNRGSGTWQERALYVVGGTVDLAASSYGQQIKAAGWAPLSTFSQGSTATQNYQLTQDFLLGRSKAHIVAAMDAKLGTTVSATITTVFAGPMPALSGDVTAAPATGATSSPADQGGSDPANFPRLPGSVRASYDLQGGSSSPRESAAYSASATVDSAEAFYANGLPPASWNELTRFYTIDDVRHTQRLEAMWQTTGRKASVTVDAAAAGGSTVHIVVTSDTTVAAAAAAPSGPVAPLAPNAAGPATANLDTAMPGGSSPALLNSGTATNVTTPSLVTAPGASTAVPIGTPVKAPPPVASKVITGVPAVTGLAVTPKSPVQHRVGWQCAAGGEVLCPTNDGSDSPIKYTYEVSKKDPNDTTFITLSPATVFLAWACAPDSTYDEDGNCSPATPYLAADVTAFFVAQTAFRVTRKDPTGGHTQAYADFVYASPPQPQEPGGFTASESPLGQVNMAWQAVPAAVAYRISEKGNSAPPARVTTTSTTFKSVKAGTHTYQVATEYATITPTPSLPEATVVVHPVPPVHAAPYLSKGGIGSAAAASQHMAAYQFHSNSSGLMTVGNTFGLLTGWDGNGFPTFRSPAAASRYANVTELGLGRSVICWQWPDTLGALTIGQVTVCIAGNHGAPVGGGALVDPSALVANASAGASSYGVIVTSPTMGQFFANFVPDPKAYSGQHDPLQTADMDWGAGWLLSTTTTLDSEGAKYTPHACLACHGGTFNATTGKVTGASLLPIDPGQVVFGNTSGSNRAANEERVRTLNAMVAASNPAASISKYINGLYGGNVNTPGTPAQASYVPSEWSQQADIFTKVVKPNCLMCHLAAPTSFGTASGFFQNKASIYADVCVGHTMPNAETPFTNFWTATGSLGSIDVSLAGLMLGVLGYNSCP